VSGNSGIWQAFYIESYQEDGTLEAEPKSPSPARGADTRYSAVTPRQGIAAQGDLVSAMGVSRGVLFGAQSLGTGFLGSRCWIWLE
jgi:hypothetical protein